MFQMAPEDRLRNVMHYQEEQRIQAALERMARTAPAENTSETSGARSARSSDAHNPRVAVIQLLRSLTDTHRAVSRHTAR
jgi:hypothetical protein